VLDADVGIVADVDIGIGVAVGIRIAVDVDIGIAIDVDFGVAICADVRKTDAGEVVNVATNTATLLVAEATAEFAMLVSLALAVVEGDAMLDNLDLTLIGDSVGNCVAGPVDGDSRVHGSSSCTRVQMVPFAQRIVLPANFPCSPPLATAVPSKRIGVERPLVIEVA